jgi:hypothetical protein
MHAPFPRTYWIVPEQFLAGPYPGSPWADGKSPLLAGLVERGFSFFLDFTEPNENDTHPYEEELMRLADEAGWRAAYHRFAITDYGVPTTDQMHAIIALLDGALAEGHRIYMHCFVGIGRTATAAGCYLVHRGLSIRQVMKTLNPESQGILGRRHRRPGTPRQRQMVETWAKEARKREE